MKQTEPIPPDEAEPLDETLFRSEAGRHRLATHILPRYISRARWFAGKARHPQTFSISEILAIAEAWIVLVRVNYTDATQETYLLPMALAQKTASDVPPHAMIAQAGSVCLYDAVYSRTFRRELLAIMAAARHFPVGDHWLKGIPGSAIAAVPERAESRVLAVEQSNSSIIYGDQLFLKLYRKIESGVNPDAEVTRFLWEQNFAHVPPFGGMIELHAEGVEPRVLALALGLIPNHGDAWSTTLAELVQFHERLLRGSKGDIGVLAGAYRERARLLGQRTGELHCALAAPVDDPRFGVEPMTSADLGELARSIESSMRTVSGLLQGVRPAPSHPPEFAGSLLGAESRILDFAARLGESAIDAAKIRTHGDYHLGQVLDTGGDFMIIDFEGEPLRPLAWRKAKRSPLRDVAGMLRSFEYAAYSALFSRPDKNEQLSPWTRPWAECVGDDFRRGWSDAVRGTPLVPGHERDAEMLLNGYLIEKALYEVVYELNHRPDWVSIPIAGILALIEKAS